MVSIEKKKKREVDIVGEIAFLLQFLRFLQDVLVSTLVAGLRFSFS